jgi:hypothetical protein
LRKRKMQKLKNKNLAVLIALLLVLTIVVPLVDLPAAIAQSSGEMASYAYVDVTPNPIGVGQTTFISMWIDVPLPQAAITNDIRRHNYTLTITKPDQTIVSQQWGVVSDSTGIQFYQFTPDQVGNYTLKFDYGGQVYTWNDTAAMKLWQGVKFLPAAKTVSLTVQQEPLHAPIDSYPLPTEYWARPIEGQNTYWYTISSNWLRGNYLGTFQQPSMNLWQKDGIGPDSPHIMWTKPIEFGGVVGGTNTGVNGSTYYSGGSYEGRFDTSLIINGYLYFKMPQSNNGATGPYVCMDLRTGQIMWQNANITPTFAQLEYFDSPNQHGVISSGYLWQISGTTWIAYDGFSGSWLFNITNVPTGTDVYGPNGELLRYQLDYTHRWLALWNFTQAITAGTLTSGGYRPVNTVISTTSTAYSWNVTIPTLNGLSAPTITAILPGDVILGQSSGITTGGARMENRGTPNPYTIWAISDKPQSRGQLLWIRNYTAPLANITRLIGPVDPINRVWTMTDTETMQWVGFSLDTGDLLWGPTTTPVRDMQFFGSGSGALQKGVTAYGNIYVQGFGGQITCYSTKNGTLLWTYNSTISGLQTPWGLNPIFIAAIADGKVYVFNNEHSPNSPYYKDYKIFCLNATTGEEIYNMLSWAGQSGGGGASTSILADGYLAYYNYYDNQIYCVGKGPSATTVSIKDDIITQGNSVMITGTVIDTATGTKQNEQVARFPNGVPAVSDDSISAWMEYVYMQKPMPTNATGVSVSLDVIDSNGNHRNIGDTTSDSKGTFSFQWTPDITGKYTIIATFEGSKSYYGSSSETYFAVDTAAPTASPYPVVNLPPTEMYIAAGVAAIIVAIAIGFAITILVLRKRP